MENEDTNFILDEIKAINSLLSGRQKEYHDLILKNTKVVHCSPISEILTKEQIDYIREVIKPKKKQCFKTAQQIAINIPEATYVEGKFGIKGLVSVEHAFNRIGDKYFDATAELALEKDITKEDYVSIMEISDGDEILDKVLELESYGALIPFLGVKYFK